MNTTDIIRLFELYVDDTTELSSSEELALLNRVYKKILTDRDWEFLKKEKTGSISGTEITLPLDFSHLIENTNYTDNSIAVGYNQRPVAVYIDDSPFMVVNWSDRRQYKNNSAYCYVDLVNNKIIFPISQSGTYSFDYVYNPADLTLVVLSDTPIFPTKYHPMIAYGMAVDDMIIQMFPKAQSYAGENQSKYNSYLSDMQMYNSKFYNG